MDVSIAIVEDEDIWAQKISEFLSIFQNENSNINFITQRYNDGDEIVDNYNGQYDLIFMDIEMRFMNGMKAAENIRLRDSSVEIIFITNMAKYAVDGYKVRAMDYVLKPIEYSKFAESLRRVLKQIVGKETKYICINQKNGIDKIAIKEIRYVESFGHRLGFHLLDKVIETTVYSMKELEQALRDEGFCRCNSGCLVNLKYVDGYKDGNIMIGSEKISVSRSRKQDFMQKLVSRMSY